LADHKAKCCAVNSARVSIVVLTYNRKDELLRTLAHLTAVGEIPIVVVDNASRDGTAEAVTSRFSEIDLIRLPRNAGAAGRNAGVAACATPYVAFCDDDTWWDRDSLLYAAAAFDRHPDLAVVTARVLVGQSERDDPTNARMACSPFHNTLGVNGTEVLGFLAGACMVRRSAFLECGGYHPRLFVGSEERLLAIDLLVAGWHMAYLPGAAVRHWPSGVRDMPARRRMIVRNGLWCAWLRRPRVSAIRETRKWLAHGRREQMLASSAFLALRGLPWVLRERRVVPDRVEKLLQQLDIFDATPMPQYGATRARTDAAAIEGSSAVS
jgi:GT2 family glycosyltransferase